MPDAPEDVFQRIAAVVFGLAAPELLLGVTLAVPVGLFLTAAELSKLGLPSGLLLNLAALLSALWGIALVAFIATQIDWDDDIV